METAYTDDGYLCHDGLFDVLLKSYYGGSAEHPPARDVDNGDDTIVQMVCIAICLHLCNDRGIICGICPVVDAVSIHLDYPVGNNYDPSQENAEVALLRGISRGLLAVRVCVRNTVCSGASIVFWIGLERNAVVDRGGCSIRRYSRHKQFCCRISDIAAYGACTKACKKTKLITIKAVIVASAPITAFCQRL